MEPTGTERYETYVGDTDTPHPASFRPAYVASPQPYQAQEERSLSPPIFVRPLGPAIPLPRKPRSVMYKAKIHDLLIYASLIISALALILATKKNGNGAGAGIVDKGKKMVEKTTELVHVVPQPTSAQQVNRECSLSLPSHAKLTNAFGVLANQPDQPEAIIHLKFPSYPPPPETPSSPLQKFLAYLHPGRYPYPYSYPYSAESAQVLASQELLAVLLRSDPNVQIQGQGQGQELPVGDLKAIERFLLKNDWMAERATVEILVRHLLLHDLNLDTDADLDDEFRDTSSTGPGSNSRRSERLRRVIDVLRPTTRSSKRQEERQREKERQKQIEEREVELGKREKQVVEALNVLAKEREKD
jgi:hypothetical protein